MPIGRLGNPVTLYFLKIRMIGPMIARLVPLVLVVLAGCNSQIYVRDHVTDGDTFYLAPQAFRRQ